MLLQSPPPAELTDPEILTNWELLLRLCAASLLGAIIGFEREWRDKPAGLRTHMLVALGSGSFASLAQLLILRFPDSNFDPARVVEGLIGGIGFLGAGSIIRSGHSVHGLTTAGSIWLAGAVGLAAGVGEYMLSLQSAVLAVAILAALRHLGSRLRKLNGHRSEDDRDTLSEEDPSNEAPPPE